MSDYTALIRELRAKANGYHTRAGLSPLLVPLLDDAADAVEQLVRERDSRAAVPPLDNHHNALECPYCNPK